MLTDRQDAHGNAMWDELHGRGGEEICERDDGLIESVPIAQYFEPFDAWDGSVRKAMEFVRGRVLDVGCGAGRHALHLQDRGHDVVGIDNSPKALEVCRLRGLEDARGCPATQVGPFLGRLDTVLMLGNDFGFTGSRKRAPWLLKRLAALTAPEARIVAETRDVYATDKPEHLAYHERNRRRGRMAGQVRLRIRYRMHATPWFDYLFVSPEEMEELIRPTPWRIHDVLSDDPDGQYVAILEKRVR